MRQTALLRVISSVALVGVLIINILANALPINGLDTGEISDRYPSLFTPTGLTFSIWSLIYVLLIGFIVYAWRHRYDTRIDKILPWFTASCLLNISWILVWHYLLPAVSVVIMLTLLSVLITIFLNVRRAGFVGWQENVWISLPFTIYLAWICVATIANISALLVFLNWNGGFLSEEMWTIGMMAVAALLSVKVVIDFGTPAFIGVVMWALFGIFLRWNQTSHQTIPVAALVMEACLLGVLIFLVRRRKVA